MQVNVTVAQAEKLILQNEKFIGKYEGKIVDQMVRHRCNYLLNRVPIKSEADLVSLVEKLNKIVANNFMPDNNYIECTPMNIVLVKLHDWYTIPSEMSRIYSKIAKSALKEVIEARVTTLKNIISFPEERRIALIENLNSNPKHDPLLYGTISFPSFEEMYKTPTGFDELNTLLLLAKENEAAQESNEPSNMDQLIAEQRLIEQQIERRRARELERQFAAAQNNGVPSEYSMDNDEDDYENWSESDTPRTQTPNYVDSDEEEGEIDQAESSNSNNSPVNQYDELTREELEAYGLYDDSSGSEDDMDI